MSDIVERRPDPQHDQQMDDLREYYLGELEKKAIEIERLQAVVHERRRLCHLYEVEIDQLRTALAMGVQLCESGGHGAGEVCPTCHFMRAAQAALGQT